MGRPNQHTKKALEIFLHPRGIFWNRPIILQYFKHGIVSTNQETIIKPSTVTTHTQLNPSKLGYVFDIFIRVDKFAM